MSNALITSGKNKRSEASRAIAQALIDRYRLTNAEEMQDAIKDIFAPVVQLVILQKV